MLRVVEDEEVVGSQLHADTLSVSVLWWLEMLSLLPMEGDDFGEGVKVVAVGTIIVALSPLSMDECSV